MRVMMQDDVVNTARQARASAETITAIAWNHT